ncbi:hypothetical protein K458DRAFT_481368 [Lentithecium fluviatile CBS 122367]|uniref:Uncharacterized protein n=1 Tax=Lentithecium fluviatile CBS 122367 TaxID=1168545 RepID=A0A6G1IHK3_9PLEO|nr:hypothetical protein K458DRAFT_481368 [Lentithecium fluviatile CBS 122367]
MSAPAQNGPRWRNSPFARNSVSPSQGPTPAAARPKSALVSSPLAEPPHGMAHARNQSLVQLSSPAMGRSDSTRFRSNSNRNSTPVGTFAPQFIADGSQNIPEVRGIEGENDFSGKRYVWLRDAKTAFVRGWIVEEKPDGTLLVQCDDGAQHEVDADSVDKVNPAKFDKADDMAELTHLNEPSVIHNLHMRYQADLIYTYSGLFLVTVNPYCPLPIYSRDYINMYKGRSREETKPHIFAMADEAFRNLVDEGANQSILVTGESVIQYLAAVATSDTPRAKSGAFGNAQTVRNNNSSRFAYIDWYLLEKSRVVRLNSNERNYHQMKRDFLLNGLEVEDFDYTKHGNDIISGVSDHDEWNALIEAFHVMGFSEKEQSSILRTVAAESRRADQAAFDPESVEQAQKVCRLLGIPMEDFVKSLLHPRVKAGREWVEKVQTPEQRGFGDLVDRINRQLDRTGSGGDDSHFIGVLDIAGFEIFEENSFEQLCINYTNEKLQQFFNHHMFIEWKFIDFGRDLQPTIDLIELPNPIGIFSCLDEDSLHSLWDRKSTKYKRSLLTQVEYSTEGWLEKNKDPLNDNHVANLFQDCADTDDELGGTRSRLHSTHPHFRPKQFSAPLVLDQLRCNGVLEEFRQRYEVLCKEMPKGYIDGQVAAKMILEKLNLDTALYRVGLTKVFFRAGSAARGFIQRPTRIIQRNFQVYLDLQSNPWWRLFVPELEGKMQQEANDKQRVEEERRRAEMDIQHKEEIFKRLQMREAELSEKLAEAIEDQDKLEDQLDLWRSELEQADLEDQITQLDQQLQELEHAKSERSQAEESLSQEERKLQDLEAKLLKTDQDLDIKLAASTKELQTTKKHIRQQIADLSSTSTSYEDLIRRKESELAILKTDLKKYESDRQIFDSEKKTLASKHDDLQSRLRDAKADLDAMDAKRLLEEKISEDEKSGEGRRLLEEQIEDLKGELFEVRRELSRERQSRDDRDFDALNESKITIEKEMYVQQDERKDYQNELRSLRERYLKLEEEKLDADAAAEPAQREELEAKDKQLDQLEAERNDLAEQVHNLTQMLADSDSFKFRNDQQKERLERELVTTKGRLTASENDNRALLNKLQQKNLDIARTNSRAGDTQRSRIAQLTNEKAKAEEENKHLLHQLEDAQLTIASLEKQKEKLSLSLEDLNHEVTREHKTSRNAEKASSTIGLQLADVNRKLETERQARTQAQANTRAVQTALDNSNRELEECRNQLVLLRKVFDPESDAAVPYESAKPAISRAVDFAERLEATNQALRVATERYSRAEAQLDELRERHEGELNEMDTRHANSKRALLEEMNSSQVNQVSARRSPTHYRKDSENRKPFSRTNTPTNQRHISNATNDSARSDRTVDTMTFNNRMDLAAELELVQNQLQMSEMRNRHLQGQIDRSPVRNKNWVDDSPSVRRVQKLERENFRLHDMLDDSAKKVSSLEHSLRSGELSYNEVQTKSHEELFDLLNSQEQSRKSIVQAHNAAVNELAEAKTAFDEIKQVKSALEAELRDARFELDDITHEREQESANHNQLLEEFADLQIRLDSETSKLFDVTSSLNLYKSRADEYFNKLEQAEIAILKASRAEQFAKTQAREAEEQCASIMAERKQMDGMIEDLQRQVQQYDERVEDLSTDLESALQAKKRLQNELEDYRSQHAHDIEDTETSIEQTRKKYQSELSTLTHELDIERENVIYVREENGRLREEIEELRNKWDDEVLNSSTWAKEKSRLEMTLQDISNSRDEAANAHNEAQSKIVSLLSQVRTLRTNVDDISAERDSAIEEKKRLESRLQEAASKLDDLSHSESPAMRNAAIYDRELLELKSGLAQQEDIAAAAVGKMRRAEALAQELQKDIVAEREANVQLHKVKASVEKNLKDLQLRLVDLETKGYSGSAGKDVRFLHGRIQELEKALETSESTRLTESRSVRNIDRTVKDLQNQIERRDKQNASITEDLNKSRDKISNLLNTIDELQSSDSTNQLAAKRAERELREEREKSLRLERELEGWKGLRVERRSALGVPGAGSDAGEVRSRRGSSIGLLMGEMGEVGAGDKGKVGFFVVGGASERGWRPGHLNPTVEEEEDEDVEYRVVDVSASAVGDDDTLVGGEYYKDVEVTDSEDGSGLEGSEGEGGNGGKECGVKRKRTIRVVIRSRAFL